MFYCRNLTFIMFIYGTILSTLKKINCLEHREFDSLYRKSISNILFETI